MPAAKPGEAGEKEQLEKLASQESKASGSFGATEMLSACSMPVNTLAASPRDKWS